MTVKYPWAPAKLHDEHGSSLYQAKSTFEAERPLLYALFLYYTYYFDCLTRIEQLVTSAYTLQDNMPLIYERNHSIASRRKLSLLAYGPNPSHCFLYYLHYVTIISDYTYYLKNQKNAIWVRIHCRKLDSWHIHHWQSVSIQTKSIKNSIIKHQVVFSHGGSWRDRPTGIGLADVRQPSSPQFRLEPIAQGIDSLGNGSALFLPDVICNSEFDTNL
jgi:hypothetical protein